MRPPPPTARRRIRAGAAGRAALLSVAVSATVVGLGLRFPGDAAPTPASTEPPSTSTLLPFPIGAVAYTSTVATTSDAVATSSAQPSDVASLVPAADTLPASSLAASGIPSTALDAYRRAAASAPASCHIDWSLVAAIGRVESNHGRFAGAVLHSDGLSTPPVVGPRLDGDGTAVIPDTDGGRLDGDPVYDRAVGPMQFIPSTWARYAQDGNGDGTADPFNIFDAARATALYLCAAGGDLSALAGQQQAVLAYNHSDSYLATVLTLAATYAGTLPPVLPAVPPAPPAVLPPVDPGPPAALTEAPVAAASPAPVTTTEPPAPTTPPVSTPPTTTTPLVTTPPTTAPPTTPPTTTPPTTTPPVATPPTATTPPTTTPPTTTPPTTATPPTTTPPVTTPPTTTAPTTTPTTPTPPTTTPVCPVDPATLSPVVVDVIDQTGNAANGIAAADDLEAAGLAVGTVTTTTGADTSAIEYPAAAETQAQQLAGDLDMPTLLAQADVPHITLLLGATDTAPLLTALHAAAAAPLCPAR